MVLLCSRICLGHCPSTVPLSTSVFSLQGFRKYCFRLVASRDLEMLEIEWGLYGACTGICKALRIALGLDGFGGHLGAFGSDLEAIM